MKVVLKTAEHHMNCALETFGGTLPRTNEFVDWCGSHAEVLPVGRYKVIAVVHQLTREPEAHLYLEWVTGTLG